jgi:hypothetical protein
MSLCVDGSGRYCQCQPDDGQPCIEIERLRARVAALEAENAELRKDAERGRWLVANLTRLCIDTNRTINRDV